MAEFLDDFVVYWKPNFLKSNQNKQHIDQMAFCYS